MSWQDDITFLNLAELLNMLGAVDDEIYGELMDASYDKYWMANDE